MHATYLEVFTVCEVIIIGRRSRIVVIFRELLIKPFQDILREKVWSECRTEA